MYTITAIDVGGGYMLILLEKIEMVSLAMTITQEAPHGEYKH
jgi:hypothetical protein